MIQQGTAPTRWRRTNHFLPRASYEEPTAIPSCCGPWYNGRLHFVTFYLCPEYWTLLDPLNPTEIAYPELEANLHKALAESFTARGLSTPALPPYKRLHKIAV